MSDKKPSIIERFRLARRVFANGLPWQSYDRGERKQLPALWPVWKNDRAEYQMAGVDTYVTEGFDMNALIYGAVMYKAKAMAQAPARAYVGEISAPELLPDGHPLSRLCQRPNPSQSWAEFIQMQSIWLNLAGEAFTYIDRKGGANGVPSALWPLNPLQMGIIPLPKNQTGYVYDKTPMLARDISHVKFSNPSDPLNGMGHGLPPMMSAARSGDVDNAITDFMYRFFKSGTMMNVYVTFGTPMDPLTMAEVRDRFKEIYGGYENWGINVGVFDSGGEVKRLGMNFDEMSFEMQDERNEARLLMAFGVPGILVGSRSGLARSTYSNYEQAQKAFWQDTMTNELRMFEDDLRYYVQSDDGGFISFDLSGIKVLQQDKPQLASAYVSLVSSGAMTKAQAAQWLGIDLPPADEPEPETSQPPDEMAGADDGEEASKAARGAKSTKPLRFQFSAEQKSAHWKAVDATARKWEAAFRDAAARVFERQRRDIAAIISGAKSAAMRSKATVDWRRAALDIDAYLDAAGDEWREVFIPILEGIVTDQGKRWAAELGMEFDIQNLRARNWFNNYALTFAQEVNQTTKDSIATILARAQADGSSVPDIQAQLDATFDAWVSGHSPDDPDFEWFIDRLPAHRTEMIARTETIRASNGGSAELFGEWGVEAKEWLATRDDRVRNSQGVGEYGNSEFDHLAADGQVVEISQPFNVSGELLYFPGDPSGSPGNTINCRCTILPVL